MYCFSINKNGNLPTVNNAFAFDLKAQFISLLISCLFCLGTAQAQESSNASGGDASGAGGSVAYDPS